MPFLSGELLRHMVGLGDGVDAVVPVIGGDRSRLARFIRGDASPPFWNVCEPAFESGGILDAVQVRYVDEDEARRFDPELLSFYYVNRPEDLARAVEIAAQKQDQRGCLAGTPTRRG